MLRLHELVNDLGRNKDLDGAVGALDALSQRVLASGPVKDALNGRWLGHPLHPALVTLPLGAWSAAAVFDLLGRDDTADGLVAFGAASALPTAASGLAQWYDANPDAKRVGVVHAAANTAALLLQMASLAARRRGRRGWGAVLSMAAVGVVNAGGYLGGHLSYASGIGVDHTAFEAMPEDWQDTGVRADEVTEAGLHLGQAAGIRVLLTRVHNELHAYAEACSHAGGPLSDGKVLEQDGGPCVQCPWHASVFRLDDGEVVASPATVPAKRFDVRVADGEVQVRRAS